MVETAVAWKNAVSSSKTPTCLVFSRQNTTPLSRTPDHIENINKGGYLLKEHNDAQINSHSFWQRSSD